MKEKNDESEFIKMQNSSSAKDTVKRMKKQATYQEKICEKHIFEK